MLYDEKTTIRRFLGLAAVALGLGTMVPADAAVPAEESAEVASEVSRGGKATAGSARGSQAAGSDTAANREPGI